VLAAVFFLTAALGLTYPLITQLSTHAAGAPYGDAFEAVRLIWWAKEALLRGLHPAFQPLLAYPDGFFSPVEWAAPMAHLAGLPFSLLFPPLIAYNLTFLASFVLTGLAAYLLCRELTGRWDAALLGGLIMMAFPTRLGHAVAGHLTLLTNYWLLLYVWSLVRLWRGPTWRRGVLSGLFFVLAAGTYPTNLAYELIPLTVVLGGGTLWRQRRRWRLWLPAVVTLALVAVLGVLILYMPLLEGFVTGRIENLREVGVVRYSADLLAFVTPSPFGPVLGRLGLYPAWAWDVLGDNIIEASAYLGMTASALAGAAIWLRRAEAKLWLLAGITGMVLSLGPVLKVADRIVTLPVEGGVTTHIALPYALYSLIPGLGMGRTPGRLNMVTAVAVAVLASLGYAALTDRLPLVRRALWRGGVLVGLAVLVMVEYQPFALFPTTEAPRPRYFDVLAEEAAQGIVRPVLNLPANDFFVTRWLLYDQTAHHQPVLAGHVVRSTPANPAMLALVNTAALPPAEEGEGFMPAMTPAQQAGILRAVGASVVVVHRDFGDGELMAAHLVGLLGPPVYEDTRVTIFEVPEAERTLRDVPVYTVQGGWDTGESSSRWADNAITIAFYIPDAQEGYWQFDAAPWLLDRWLHLSLADSLTESFWLPADNAALVSWRSSVYRPAAGFQQVRFQVEPESDDCTRLPDEPGCRRVLVRSPRFVFDDEDQARGVLFGDTMRFVSADVQCETTVGRCDLRLYWQALGDGRADYTMFVHMLDSDNGLVAQWDGLLGGPDMPTSRWPDRGFAFQDAVLTFDPAMLEPGSYRLYTGLYTYPDLTRLPVYSDRPGAGDRMLYLQDYPVSSPADR